MNKYRQRGKMRMEKIKMTTPLVEMDGDEMTRVLWQLIKDELLTPFVDLNTEYYDLGLVHRNETNDQQSILLKQLRNTVLQSSVQPLHRMQHELKNMT